MCCPTAKLHSQYKRFLSFRAGCWNASHVKWLHRKFVWQLPISKLVSHAVLVYPSNVTLNLRLFNAAFHWSRLSERPSVCHLRCLCWKNCWMKGWSWIWFVWLVVHQLCPSVASFSFAAPSLFSKFLHLPSAAIVLKHWSSKSHFHRELSSLFLTAVVSV